MDARLGQGGHIGSVGRDDATSLIQVGLGEDPLLDEVVVHREAGVDELVDLALVGLIHLDSTSDNHVVVVVVELTAEAVLLIGEDPCTILDDLLEVGGKLVPDVQTDVDRLRWNW